MLSDYWAASATKVNGDTGSLQYTATHTPCCCFDCCWRVCVTKRHNAGAWAGRTMGHKFHFAPWIQNSLRARSESRHRSTDYGPNTVSRSLCQYRPYNVKHGAPHRSPSTCGPLQDQANYRKSIIRKQYIHVRALNTRGKVWNCGHPLSIQLATGVYKKLLIHGLTSH